MITIFASNYRLVPTENEYILLEGCDLDTFLKGLPDQKMQLSDTEVAKNSIRGKLAHSINSWFGAISVFGLNVTFTNFLTPDDRLLKIDANNIALTGSLLIYGGSTIYD